MILPRFRRSLGLIGLGAVSAAALPPVNLVFLLWICLPLLLHDADRRKGMGGAFLSGWLFGIGHFAVGLYWISEALLVDAARFGWMIPFALGGLGAVAGLYIGAATALTRLARPGWRRLLLFAGLWCAGEMLRGQLLTGFPWNPIGSVWSSVTPMMQSAAVFGVFGLGLLTILAATAPALLQRSRRQGVLASLGGLTLLLAIGVAGWIRVPDAAMATQPGIRLRLVQGNIPQTLKWDPQMRAEHLARHLALSRAPSELPPTHIIWPETAAPSFLDQDLRARQAIAAAAPEAGLMLVGTLRGQIEGGELTAAWNSLEAIDHKGEILGHYDKAHLVPFGEYVPLPSWLGLRKLTAVSMDISAGPGPRTLSLPGLPPFGASICYEAIFPGAVADEADRPQWLLNLTNDGWFGSSSGPYQHFVAARFRAVEEGLPLVRAAYTGISAVIDPYGRVVASLGINQQGVVDSPLPQPLGETIFIQWGGPLIAFLLMITAIPALLDKIWRSQLLWVRPKKPPRVID